MTLKLISQLMMIMIRNTHQTRVRIIEMVESNAIMSGPWDRIADI
jgi:hypothetical protein